jgi:hypothetical protein
VLLAFGGRQSRIDLAPKRMVSFALADGRPVSRVVSECDLGAG